MKIKIEHEEIFVKPVAEPLERPGHYRGQAYIRGRAVIDGHVVVFQQRLQIELCPPNGVESE